MIDASPGRTPSYGIRGVSIGGRKVCGAHLFLVDDVKETVVVRLFLGTWGGLASGLHSLMATY